MTVDFLISTLCSFGLGMFFGIGFMALWIDSGSGKDGGAE